MFNFLFLSFYFLSYFFKHFTHAYFMFSSDHLKFLECLSLIFIVSGAARSYPTLSNPMDWAHQAHQAPLFMGFSRQEHWSGLPFLSLGELPHPGIKTPSPVSPALAGRFYQLVPPGKPFIVSAASQLFLVYVCVCVFKLWIIFYWMKSTRISRVYAGHVGYKDVNISFQAISSYEMSSLLSSLNSC